MSRYLDYYLLAERPALPPKSNIMAPLWSDSTNRHQTKRVPRRRLGHNCMTLKVYGGVKEANRVTGDARKAGRVSASSFK